MDFKKYKYVIKVAECRNFTRAANELYMSQPSLSYYISNVEELLGVKLFNRGTNPITLTPEGDIFVKKGKKIIAIHEELEQELLDISNYKKSELTVAMARSRSYYLLPNIYSRLLEKYPNIKLNIIEAKSEHIEDFVLQDKADFAVKALHQKYKKIDNLSYKIINKEKLVVIAKTGFLKKNQYNKNRVINLSKLENVPFIMLEKGRGIRFSIDEFFSENKYKANIIHTTTSNITALKLASSGIGIAIVPQKLVDFLSDPNIECFELSKESVMWDVCFIYKNDCEFMGIKEEFHTLAKDC